MLTFREFIKESPPPAWHGSPHHVDAFSIDKVGTGEGAQSYGWGLYFASKKEVAEYYQQGLGGFTFRGEPVSREASEAIPTDVYKYHDLTGKSADDFVQWTKSPEGRFELAKSIMYDYLISYSDVTSAKQMIMSKLDRGQIYRDALDLINDSIKNGDLKSTGFIYHVEILPSEDTMLDFDQPLIDQSEFVQNTIRNSDWYTEHASNFDLDNTDGEQIYYSISKYKGSDKEASMYLLSIGIRGIKYWDGVSRAEKGGSHNYVIFDDNDVVIKEKV